MAGQPTFPQRTLISGGGRLGGVGWLAMMTSVTFKPMCFDSHVVLCTLGRWPLGGFKPKWKHDLLLHPGTKESSLNLINLQSQKENIKNHPPRKKSPLFPPLPTYTFSKSGHAALWTPLAPWQGHHWWENVKLSIYGWSTKNSPNVRSSEILVLVGGWTNPFEKYDRQIGSFPQRSGWK